MTERVLLLKTLHPWMDTLAETLEEKERQKIAEALVTLTRAAHMLAEAQYRIK